jgi:hypothetical protein
MTRKDFVLIAEAVKEVREKVVLTHPTEEHDKARELLDLVTRRIAWRLGQTNDRFDYQRFQNACGMI